MGVRGLTSLIGEHPSLFCRHQLHDVRLVIDGYALLYFLYQDPPACDDGHHGGRYQHFATKCQSFFRNLAKCNVSTFVLFDGAYEKDDKKLAEVKTRCTDRVRTAVGIASGSSALAFAPCVSMVFKKVLDDLGIPYAYSNFEADAETAALANAWNCAAASRDSDFYILDLRAGYIPLDHLEWKNPRQAEESKSKPKSPHQQKKKAPPSASYFYIDCLKYQGSAFCKMYKVKQSLLPVLATAVGNDYKETFGKSLTGFHGFVLSQFSRSKTKSKSYNQITSYLSWLSEKETIEEAVSDMIKHERGASRLQLKKLIEASLEMYSLPDCLAIEQVLSGTSSRSGSTPSKMAICASIPQWFVELLTRGKVEMFCANVLCTNRVFLRIQVEDPSQQSAAVPSVHIRSVVYGILLWDQRSLDKIPPIVEEYAQGLSTLKHILVEPVYEIDGGDGMKSAIPSLGDVPAMTASERRQFLLSTLGINSSIIEGIPESFQLATCVTVYLIHHAEPLVRSDHVLALTVSWLQGVATTTQEFISRRQSTPSLLQIGLINSDVYALMKNCRSHANKYKKFKKFDLDLEVTHKMAQWQQCLLDVVNLNKVLLEPFPNPDMAVLYNGPLIHSICSVLRPLQMTEQYQLVISELLQGTQRRVRALFDRLLEPTWPLLTPRQQKTAKSRRRKRPPSRGTYRPPSSTTGQAERTESSVGGEVRYNVNVTSRFGPLAME
ncbi:single-strand DNA endonuclease ASTE1-like [Asterias amurensis]|uniref:single-strand DNA endonuclease ASTE1-like n=1 Tax=Asterias amurensis TaxID=7602 RepID=UPI003AB206A0